MTALAPSSNAGSPDPGTPEARRPYSRTTLTLGIIGRTWLWFVAGCLAVTLLPVLIGWRPFVVESGSMEPRIHVGDVVLAAPVDDPKLLVGRVTVFDSPEKPGETITHRVVRIQDGELVTKGDANPTADSAHVPESSVRGIGRLLVKWVGLPLIWLQTGQWLWLLLFLASLWLAVVAVVRDREEQDLEDAAADADADGDGDTNDDGGGAGDNPADDEPADGPAAPAAPAGPGSSLRTALGTSWKRLTRLIALSRLPRRRRTVWQLRAFLVVGCTLLLAVPSSFAAFAATTASTNDVWTVPTYDYSTEVTNLGPYLYWRFEETGTATTAADSSGNGRTGTYNPSGSTANFTRLPAGGALVHDVPDNAVQPASTTACVNTTSTTAIAAPAALTEIIWFKAAVGYNSGGKLIGFETPRTGVAVAGSGGTYDRHLYMDGAGKVWFGVYNGADFVISSPTALNDGAWHMAAGVFGTTGMHLYIDGVQVASNANTGAEATTGWFRVGCGNLAGWSDGWTGPNTPPASATATNYTFRGGLDEAAVFTSQLTASQIAFLYWAR